MLSHLMLSNTNCKKILSGAAVNTTKSPKSSGAGAPSTKEMQSQALFSGAQTGVINIQNLAFPGASAPSKSKLIPMGRNGDELSLSPQTKMRTKFNKYFLFDDTFCEELHVIVCSLSFIHNQVVGLTASIQ